MSTFQLRGDGLACVRGGRVVFEELGFEVPGGTALALRGANGVGKSSLLRLIAGLVRPTAGQLTLEGGDPELPIGEQAHYLGHLDAIKPALSVAENLDFWARFLGTGEPPHIDAALDAVGLGILAGLPARTLSAGQRRRLALARVVAVKRPLWLLDEPTSALDSDGQARLFELIANHLAGGGMIVIATHTDLPLATRTLRLEVAA